MSEITILDDSYTEKALFFHEGFGTILRPLEKESEFLGNPNLQRVLKSFNVVDYRVENYGGRRFLEVEPFSFPNSAANWSYGMYRDAIACIERLSTSLSSYGYSLIDGHCFNVVFYYDVPVFVDLGSFIPGGSGQGIAELAGYRKALTSYRLSSACHTRRRLDSELEAPRYLDVVKDLLSRDPFISWRSRLRRLIGLRGGSAWIEYYSASPESYRDIPKENVVRAILEQERPRTVYDIGCNTGHYAVIAERCGASVVAADPDPDCVDHLYKSLKGSGKKILPLVADLDGFVRAVERPYRNLRPKSVDMILMLALLHHLVYRAGLTFEEVFERVGRLGADSVMIEFISKDDSNVASWDRQSFHDWYNLDNLCRVGGRHFASCRVYGEHDPERKIVHFKERISS